MIMFWIILYIVTGILLATSALVHNKAFPNTLSQWAVVACIVVAAPLILAGLLVGMPVCWVITAVKNKD